MANGKSALIVVLLVTAGGGYAAKKYFVDNPRSKVAKAMSETFPVHGTTDAADDVAIWVDPSDGSKSLIVAVDRQHGLAVYDLKGGELDFVELARAENIDLRAKAKVGDRELTLVATTDSLDHRVHLFELATEKPYLRALPNGTFDTEVQANGLCLYRNPTNAEISVYVLGKERDPAREAKEKLSFLKKERLAAEFAADAEKMLAADEPSSPPTSEKPAKPDKAGGKKGDKAAQEPMDEAAKLAQAERKAERKAERAKAKEKDTSKKSKDDAKSKPTKEEEELAKIASQPTKSKRSRFVIQMKLGADETGAIHAVENRRIRLDGDSEGCVVDDDLGALFISEEEKGVWTFRADGTKDVMEVGELICKVGFPDPLFADVEGLALYREDGGKGYLVVSSQGSEDCVVLDRQAPHAFRGRFRVEGQGGVDAVENSDSLDVTSADLGGSFGKGLLILQDDKNMSAAGGRENANFKLVPWSEIVTTLGL